MRASRIVRHGAVVEAAVLTRCLSLKLTQCVKRMRAVRPWTASSAGLGLGSGCCVGCSERLDEASRLALDCLVRLKRLHRAEHGILERGAPSGEVCHSAIDEPRNLIDTERTDGLQSQHVRRARSAGPDCLRKCAGPG